MKERKYKIGDWVIVMDENMRGPKQWVGQVVDHYEDGDYNVLDHSDGLYGTCSEDILRPLSKLHKALK